MSILKELSYLINFIALLLRMQVTFDGCMQLTHPNLPLQNSIQEH